MRDSKALRVFFFGLFSVFLTASVFSENMFRNFTDFDGDGKTDIAIYRSGEQSYFWVKGTQAGVYVLAWGVSGDSIVKY